MFQSPIQRAWRVGLAALCATAFYELTLYRCFPRMSIVQSNIITVVFAGCIGFCISFLVRRGDRAAQRERMRLAAVVESSDDAISSIDLDGNVTSWNGGAEHTYGYSSAEAMGRHISFCIPPEKRAEFGSLVQKIGVGEVIEPVDTQRRKKDGTIIEVSLSLAAIKDHTGRVVGISGIARDITAQKRAQEVLTESEKRYRSLSERVIQRTRELTAANKHLAAEMIERRQAQEGLRLEALAREHAEFELRRGEERMRIAMEAAKIGFWDLDVVKDEHVWSDTCKVLLGVAPCSTANYQALMNAVHPGDWERMQAEIDRALEEKREYACEFRVVWSDKSVHWRRSNGRAFYDDAGNVTRMSGITMDIDERKSAEEQLNRQAAALEATANAIVITDVRGTVVWVNQAFATMTGYSKEEIVGNNPRLLKSGEQSEEFYGNLWATILSGKVWQGELVNRRKDGTTYSEEMTITPIMREAGSRVGQYFIAVKQDITQRKRVEKELQLTQFSLEHASEAIHWADSQGRIVYCNEAACHAVGRSREELLSLSVTDIAPKFIWKAFWKDLTQRRSITLEGQHETKAGKLFPVEITATYVEFGGQEYSFAFSRDISDRKRNEEALLFKTALLEAQSETTIDAILVVDESDHIVLANQQFKLGFDIPEKMLQAGNDLAVRKHMAMQVEDSCGFLERVKYLCGHRDEKVRDEVRFKNGRILDRYSAPLVDSNGQYRGRIWYFRDITDNKRAEDALRRAEEKYRAIFEDALIGIFQSTPGGRYNDVNPAMARMLGYDSPQEMVASITDIGLQVYADPHNREEFKRLLREQGKVKNFECEVYRKDHSKVWISSSARVLCRDGVLIGYEGTNEDITTRKAAESRIQYLAYYDALTGLANRTLLQDRLSKALASARRRRDKVALLFIDLDRFKIINDSLGHPVGDILLQEVAERLKKFARDQDTVARLGGDEFLVVATAVKDASDAAVVGERLMDAMNAKFVIEGHDLNVSCSLGISIFPDHGSDGETLIKNADASMYCAKENGRNNFQFFSEDMNTEAVERLTLENSLRAALAQKELFLMYQPQMDIASGQITGLEALLRWQHPELGLVPPDKFIRIAENSGLIIPIGEWVLRTACAQARRWQQEGLFAVPVAVNVSAMQFRQEHFCELVGKVLQETGLDPQYLELELTESLLTNTNVTLSGVQKLRDLGLKLAIDDFGTGYSSFSYLRQFRVNKLKIDGSFVRDVAVNPDDAAIAIAIISMAKSLNLKVIAEGVETQDQMSFLRAHQCDEIQGYYYSKPLAVEDVGAKLRDKSAETIVRAQATGGQP